MALRRFMAARLPSMSVSASIVEAKCDASSSSDRFRRRLSRCQKRNTFVNGNFMKPG